MAIQVPAWIARDLGLAELYETEDELLSAVEDSLTVSPIDLITSLDVVDALTVSLSDELEVVAASSRGAWRFSEVSIGGTCQCQAMEPGTHWADVPTNSVRMTLWAWSKEERFSPLTWNHPSGFVIVRWLANAGAKKLATSLVLSSLGIVVPEQWDSPALTASAATNVEIAASSLLLREQLVYGELIQAALRHTSPSLRFLYLYRLFEHAYLINALDKLQANFFADPKRSAKILNDVVGNEKAAFLALLDLSTSTGDFEAIAEVFEGNQRSKANKYLSAVNDGAVADGELGYQEKWKRGCVLCYKLRCSIVHSGKSSPIFESYPDAAQGVLTVLPSLESAAFSLLEVGMV